MGGGLQDRRVAGRLAGAGRELDAELRAEYRKASRAAARKTQDRIRAAASRHDGALRAEIAATVIFSTRVRGGGMTATISSLGTRMPAGKRNLAAYANAGAWRHPVYGRDVWVRQEWGSAAGWFDATLRAEQEHFAEATRRALGNLAARLGR
jgi:hypothetical protein